MKNIFTNDQFNQALNQEGYVIINEIQDEVYQNIDQLFETFHSEHQSNGFNTTHFSFNKKYKEEVFKIAKNFFDRQFAHLFVDYDVIFANLMVKNPGSNDILPVHADWVYADESQYSIISIWMPMIDTCIENGALGIIPKSHLLYEKIRGPEIVSAYRKFDHLLKEKRGKLLPIKKHEALIYDLRLLHFSLPNQTNKNRVAINITLAPKNAKLVHYIQHDDVIHKYENIDADFFLNYNAHQIPEEITPVATLPIQQQISDSDILNFYQLHKEEMKPNLLKRLKSYFLKE